MLSIAQHIATPCRATDVLLNDLAAGTIVLADKAYDSNAIRDLIERQGAFPNIPSKANRRWKSCFSRTLYKGRNAVECMFCRLKDYRRIAPRYDKLGANLLSAIYLAAATTGASVPAERSRQRRAQLLGFIAFCSTMRSR